MKKLLLGLGTLTAIVAPIAIIVACGNDSNSAKNPQIGTNGNLLNEDYEQGLVNNLLSIGATTTPADAARPTKAPLDAAAITKYGIKNADKSPHSFDSQYTYEYTATATAIKIYVSKNGVQSSVAPVEILISRNSFSGTFFTLSKEKEFLAATTIGDPINDIGIFHNEIGLTHVSLLNVTSIGARAFFSPQLSSLEIPLASTIGDYAFQNVWNEPASNVTMQYKFNIDTEKDRIFGPEDWNQINFTWIDEDGIVVDVAYLRAFLDSFSDAAQAQTGDSTTLAAARTALRNKINTLKSTYLDNNQIFGYDEKIAVIQLWDSLKLIWQTGMNSVLAPYKAESIKTTGDAAVATARAALAAGITIWDNYINGVTPATINILLETNLNNDLTPLINAVIDKIKDYVSDIISNYIDFAVADSSDSTEAAIARTALRDAIADWTQKVSIVTAFTINTIDALDARGINIVQADLDALQAAIYNAISSTTGVVNTEQTFVNALLSIGATATTSDSASATPSVLDAAAVAKYGIKNANNTPYIFKSDFTYKYTATDTEITIVVTKNGTSSDSSHLPLPIRISPNNFEGAFTSLVKTKEFLAAIDSVSQSQFSSDNQLTHVMLPRVTSIGNNAFDNSQLIFVFVPLATTVGDNAFIAVPNFASTIVSMQYKFNTNADKDRIFGAGNWDKITFRWYDRFGELINIINPTFNDLVTATEDTTNGGTTLSQINPLPIGVSSISLDKTKVDAGTTETITAAITYATGYAGPDVVSSDIVGGLINIYPTFDQLVTSTEDVVNSITTLSPINPLPIGVSSISLDKTKVDAGTTETVTATITYATRYTGMPTVTKEIAGIVKEVMSSGVTLSSTNILIIISAMILSILIFPLLGLLIYGLFKRRKIH